MKAGYKGALSHPDHENSAKYLEIVKELACHLGEEFRHP